jgi:thioredoxin reductase
MYSALDVAQAGRQFKHEESKRSKTREMALYIDIHNLPGVTSEAAAEAHFKDLQAQANYGVNYKRYWVNEGEGKVFCLVEAPDAETAETVHREAHGLVADQIFEVSEGS